MHHSLHALFLSHQSAKSVPKTFFPHCLRSQIVIPRSLPTNPTFSLRNNGEEDPEDFRLLSGSKKLRGSGHGSQALRTEEGQVEKEELLWVHNNDRRRRIWVALLPVFSFLDPHEALKMAAFSRRWQWTIIIRRLVLRPSISSDDLYKISDNLSQQLPSFKPLGENPNPKDGRKDLSTN
ncbi:hypothetical protein AAC387_Pa07g3588 [Persea americana]